MPVHVLEAFGGAPALLVPDNANIPPDLDVHIVMDNYATS